MAFEALEPLPAAPARTVVDPRRKDYAVLSLRDPGTLLGYPVNTLWRYGAYLRGGGRPDAPDRKGREAA